MKTSPLPAGHRLIGWNGLHLVLPVSWEVMVSGLRHLLIEYNFAPVLEIRWDSEGKGSPEDIMARATQRFADPRHDVRVINPPQPFAALGASRCITWLAWHSGNHPDGLLWQCPDCRTMVLCRLYPHHKEMTSQIAAVLGSVQCHRDNGVPSFWSIQDFQLILAPGFNFTDSTFAAGLSRLAFSGNGLKLQFCRLAPAATRLAAASLPQLLGTLLGGPLPEEIIADAPELYECSNNPSASRRLLARLRRLPPFRWGMIRHDSPHDRLLAITAESNQAIDLTIVHDLCLHYEIVSPNHHITTINTQPC